MQSKLHQNLFLVDDAGSDEKALYALVILNSVGVEREILKRCWKACKFHVCCDGGANRLFHLLGNEREDYIPNTIIGDLDSLEVDVRNFYE